MADSSQFTPAPWQVDGNSTIQILEFAPVDLALCLTIYRITNDANSNPVSVTFDAARGGQLQDFPLAPGNSFDFFPPSIIRITAQGSPAHGTYAGIFCALLQQAAAPKPV
jgi:hypothetical protein